MNEALLLDRAQHVRNLGRDIGLVEWLAWGVLHERRVMMIFGDTVIDILEWFAPTRMPSLTKPPCCAAAARMTPVPGQFCSSAPEPAGLGQHMVPRVSHYVIGVPSALAHSVGVAPADLGSPPSVPTRLRFGQVGNSSPQPRRATAVLTSWRTSKASSAIR